MRAARSSASPAAAPASTSPAPRSRRSRTRRSTPSVRRRRASGEALSALKADGGAVANDWLMQFQADVLGVPVIVPEVPETTALGAAYLAGIATGLWTSDQVREMWRQAAAYEPTMAQGARDELLARWRDAVGRSRGWAREEA